MLATSPELVFPAWEQPSRVVRVCGKYTTHLRHRERTLATAHVLCSTQDAHCPEKARTDKSIHSSLLPSEQAWHSRTSQARTCHQQTKTLCLHVLVFKVDRPELTCYSDHKTLDQTGFCSNCDHKTLNITYSQAFSCPGKNTTQRLITTP